MKPMLKNTANEWREVSIGEVAEKIAMGPFGSSIKVETFVDEGIPIISGTHLREIRLSDTEFNFISKEHASRLANSLVRKGDIVFTHAGNIGQVSYIPETAKYSQYIISQRQFFMRCDTTVALPEFITYYFKTHEGRHKLLANASQVGVPSIARPTTYLKSIKLHLPPIHIQRKIVETLSCIGDKIEALRALNESLERSCQELYRDWLIDFGPTRAKMAGQAPYLAPEVWALFPDALDNDRLPGGWSMQTLGEHCVNLDSKRIPLSSREREQRKGQFPYHGATSVMDHVDDYLFDGVHLLVGEDGSVMNQAGKAFTQYVWGKFWVNNHAHVLKGKGAVCTEHLLLYFQHHDVSPYITGAVQMKLSQGRMNAMPFLYPGKDLCVALEREVAPLFEKIRANANEVATLAATRDLLLPKLMSGELKIKDADALIRKTV